MIRRISRTAVVFLLILGFSPFVDAHEVPNQQHDRTIQVKLSGSTIPQQQYSISIDVHYRLELAERTAIEVDLFSHLDKIDVTQSVDKQDLLYSALLKIKAPQIAKALSATVDDEPVAWKIGKSSYALINEQGQPLGHLRCDFFFHAEVPITQGSKHTYTFRDNTYLLELGQMRTSISATAPIVLSDTQQASTDLQKKPLAQWGPDEERELRSVSTTFTVPKATDVTQDNPPTVAKTVAPVDTPSSTTSADSHSSGLLELFMSSQYSVWILIVLSTLFGAVHALTPGHGKTLVAAYLVGERGTALHALVLGLVTTITHTGIVILLATVLLFVPMDHESKEAVQFLLGLGMGLLIAGLGVWLLLRRLAGQVDHIHVGGHHHHHHGHHHHGGHHHHHHDHRHDHDHDTDGTAIPKKVSWWGLIVLGMSGGIIPCWDAVAMLLVAIGKSWFWLALPMLLAFSAGLATVLVIIGLMVVYVKRFTESHWGSEKLVRILSILSALTIIAIGFWLCYDSLYGVS